MYVPLFADIISAERWEMPVYNSMIPEVIKMVSGTLALKNGYYYAVLSYQDAAGKRHQKWVSTGLPQKGNKRRAEQELIRIRSEFEIPPAAGELNSNMLFADYLDQWLEVVRARIKPATFGSYQGMVKSTIGPYFREKELTLKELEARHIQQFYTEKLKTVTPNSVIHYHAVIYQALKYAMKTDMVPQNVAMKVDRPRKNSFQPTFLDAEQMQKLFEVVKGTRLELPVLVAAFYGLRRGEVLGLKWDAIDFNRGTLTIKRTVTEATIDGTMKIIEQDSAKTKSSLRTLPLVGSFRDYFQKVKEAQELNKKVCGNCYNYDYDGYVFVNELGERMRPNYLTEYFPKYIAKHGMPKMRFHDLRHPYVKHTTKIFSLRLMDFQAQAYPDARRKTRGACQLLRVGQSRSPVRPLYNRKRFSCLPPQSKMSWILYAISMRLSGYTSTRSISISASSVVSASASKIALDASFRLSCRACSSCFCFACANTAA